jgi:hypothetical protein
MLGMTVRQRLDLVISVRIYETGYGRDDIFTSAFWLRVCPTSNRDLPRDREV